MRRRRKRLERSLTTWTIEVEELCSLRRKLRRMKIVQKLMR